MRDSVRVDEPARGTHVAFARGMPQRGEAYTWTFGVGLPGVAIRLLVWVALGVTSPRAADAGSFFLEEQSVTGSGRALAGQSALADDASALFYNPANVAGKPWAQVTLGTYTALTWADLDDAGSATATPGSGGSPVVTHGGDGGNPFAPTILGGLAMSMPLPDERSWVGLGVSVPFGIDSDYGDEWFGRYSTTRTELIVADVSPTAGIALTDTLTVGASLIFRYARGKLESALPDPLAPGGPSPATDGAFSVEGDDWDLAYALGLRWEPRPGTTLGLAYRSGTRADLDGHARFSGLNGPLAARNGRISASTQLRLPSIALLGIAHQLTPRWMLMAQVNRFEWSDFDVVQIDLADGTRIDNVQGYHDTWSVSVGTEYRYSERLTLRAGAEIDKSPVDDRLRPARTPDDDRLRVAAGFTYALRDNLKIDFAYVHVFVEDSDLDRTDAVFAGTPVVSSVRTHARTEARSDLFGLSLRYHYY